MTTAGQTSPRNDDIAIVGMAVHVPGATSLDAYWANLRDGVSSIRSLDEAALLAAGEAPDRMARSNYVPAAATLDGFDMFDADFFGFSPKEAAILDPQHRKFLEVSWEALETAGHTPENFAGKIGVYAGCGMGSYFYFNICSNPGLVDDTGMFLLRHTGNDKDFLSTRVSHVLNLKGPSINIQTACSTSLVAVHYARQALLSGDCDMALAGGATIELPHGRGYLFAENEILSPDGQCHAFDHRAQGTVFGSGAGAIALRRLSDAIADGDHIWAVIKGSAINNDGADKAGYLAPSVSGQAEAIRTAHRVAGVTADSIGYVECHGTGTYLGDPIEVSAMTEAFRSTTAANGFCRIGSVKTNIGHLDTAAGIASLTKTALALHHKSMPPSLGYESPNPVIDFNTSPFKVNDRLTAWDKGATPRRAGVNSLGVGGTNAHLVMEEAPVSTSEESDWPFHILTISGRSKAALEANTSALAAHLRAHPKQSLADVAFTLKQGRRGFEHRRVVVAESHAEAADLLESKDRLRVFTHKQVGPAPEVTFMFPGGGAQYAGMGRDLYETEPVFADWMDRGLAHLQPKLDYDLRAIWLPEPGQEADANARLQQPSVQLPLIMMVEYALAQLWMSWGVQPTALVGHSMGENTAACVAGVMTFEQCIDLVLLRGRLFDTVPRGGMLSVPLSLDAVRPYLNEDLDIASLNGPELTAVSGPQAALDALQTRLAADEITAQRIPIDIAAHSRMLDPILSDFRAFLSKLDLRPPQIPFLSNRSGAFITDAEARDPEYWVAHLRHTVHFADCMTTLGDTPNRVYLEVGPGKALATLARMCPSISADQVIGTLRHSEHDIADDIQFMGVIGRLWATGVEADWSQIWGEARRLRLPLPTYAFQRSRYFIEPGVAAVAAPKALTRREAVADWGYLPVWQPTYAKTEIDLQTGKAMLPAQTWLVFVDDTGLGLQVTQDLRAHGHRMVQVHMGDSFARRDEFSYSLAPEMGRDGYDLLLGDLAARDLLPNRIAHMWLVTDQKTFRPGSSFFDRNRECGFFSLTWLAQALGDQGVENTHILAMTNGAAQVLDEALPYPEKAMIAGPAAALAREFPGLTCATLDIALPAAVTHTSRKGFGRKQAKPTLNLVPLVAQLRDDLFAMPANTVAALRGAQRLEQTYRATNLPEAKPVFQTGGTYLITGGFGGIGQSLAQMLARDYQANLILVTRRAQPARAVETLESLGARVAVITADICDLDQMQHGLAEATAKLGTVTGVIHAAGVIDDAPLMTKTAAALEAVLAPKVQGLRVLDALFPDGSIAQMILFASTSTAIRPAGQVDYVAANEYLNAYARHRAGGKTHVTAINWGIWAEVGMAAQAVGLAPATPQAASPTDQPLLDEVTVDDTGNALFRTQFSAKTHWLLDEHRTAEGAAILPGTGYLELIAQAMQAQGNGGFEIHDLMFLNPLAVADDARQEVQLRLSARGNGYAVDVQSPQRVAGKTGLLTHARAQVELSEKASGQLDLSAITARLQPSKGNETRDLRSPQEVHLAFGPRWRVLQQMQFGDGEGMAKLALPAAAQGDLAQGYLMHPALLDLATGWAIELAQGYAPDHLWVPLGYGRVRVFAPLPAEIYSWVRLSENAMDQDGFTSFDVTICGPDGTICIEVESFTMQRLDAQSGFGAGRIDPAQLAPITSPKPQSPAQDRLAYNVSQGIRPNEGAEALTRALSLGETQVYVSSLDMLALAKQAQEAPQLHDNTQKFERPNVDTDFVAPSSETEKTLAGFWQDLLGVSAVGVNDSFFDLGGHSLIAVRLFGMIKKTFKIDLPISVLFDAPSIATCAALIDERTGDTCQSDQTTKPQQKLFTHLVKMAPGTDPGQTPFFLVAGMFGNVLNLRHLAQLLGSERPVYGLQARGLLGDQAPHESMAEAAADYLAEIRQIQPEGPYLLGGFSGGGITAYEMAQQLRSSGEEVAALVMLDTPLPVRPSLSRKDKALIKLHEFRRKGVAYLAEWAQARAEWNRKLRAMETEAGAAPAQFQDQAIEAAFLHAVGHYDTPRWEGPMTLFRPPLDQHWAVSKGKWVSAAKEYVFEDNAWTPFAPRLEVIEVPGDHDSMVLEPNVRTLSRHLRGLLKAAETGTDRFPQKASLFAPATAAE